MRESHLVGKDGAFVEGSIAIRVFEHEDAVGRIFFELFFVPVYAHGIANKKSAAIIETAHDGMRDERRGCGDGERVACGKVVFGQGER